jgi:RHS repeat-associated protein
LNSQATYVYDALGNRAEKDTASGGTTTVTRFAYDDAGNAWADLNGSSSLTTRRIFVDGVDSVAARITGSTLAFYLPDHLGSIRNLTDGSGNLTNTITYDGFGKVTSETSTANSDRYKFTGRELDSETGLQYHLNRYYDPATGRWTSADPIEFGAADPNLYRYVRNAPTRWRDPTGRYLVANDEATADLWTTGLRQYYGFDTRKVALPLDEDGNQRWAIIAGPDNIMAASRAIKSDTSANPAWRVLVHQDLLTSGYAGIVGPGWAIRDADPSEELSNPVEQALSRYHKRHYALEDDIGIGQALNPKNITDQQIDALKGMDLIEEIDHVYVLHIPQIERKFIIQRISEGWEVSQVKDGSCREKGHHYEITHMASENVSSKALVDAFIRGPAELRGYETLAETLTFVLHLLPFGGAADKLVNDYGTWEDAIISTADGFAFLATGGAAAAAAACRKGLAKALYVTSISLQSGVIGYKGYEAYKEGNRSPHYVVGSNDGTGAPRR